MAAQERAALGLPGAGGPAGVPGVTVAAVVAPIVPFAPPAGGGAGVGGAAGVIGAPPGLPAATWIVDEPTGTRNIGDTVVLPPGAVTLGSRALVVVDGDVTALKRLDPGADVGAYVAARKALLSDDPRIIPEKVRGFTEAAEEMTHVTRELPLAGPASGNWLVTEVARNGGGFVSRHMRWRRESGIKPTDRLVYEHEVLSRSLEMAAAHDGINIRNVAFAEYLMRRLQLLEEAVAENPEQPSYEGSKHYMGVEERKGGALMAPTLRAHVAAELQRETAILKEKRKAREARGGGRGPGAKGAGRGEP